MSSSARSLRLKRKDRAEKQRQSDSRFEQISHLPGGRLSRPPAGKLDLAGGEAALLEVALVVVLGRPEGAGGDDLGGDRLAVLALLALPRCDRLLLLLGS